MKRAGVILTQIALVLYIAITSMLLVFEFFETKKLNLDLIIIQAICFGFLGVIDQLKINEKSGG